MEIPDLKWKRLGRVLYPQPHIEWMATFTGSSCLLPVNPKNPDAGHFHLYVTGRDAANRSRIGKLKLFLDGEHWEVSQIDPEPVLELGVLGTFDENGTSYPCMVSRGGQNLLFYVGWRPTIMTPFINQIGLAKSNDEKGFARVSKAPVLPLTNEEPYGSGSMYVMDDKGMLKMWYTCFTGWEKNPETGPKHYYNIRYAESRDGLHWIRPNITCIDFLDESEYAICHPAVVKFGDTYHMWFAHRGEQYQIGYATSRDGLNWDRLEKYDAMGKSAEAWDSQSVTYPYVLRIKNRLYMIYCGNGYGKEGLGIAVLDLADVDPLPDMSNELDLEVK